MKVVNLLRGCARAVTSIFQRASPTQPNANHEISHGEQQWSECQQLVMVPTDASSPQVLPLSGLPDTVVGAPDGSAAATPLLHACQNGFRPKCS
jgi:hypothetical protein